MMCFLRYLFLSIFCMVIATESVADEIPWQNEMFQHVSVEEDLRDVIQSLMDQSRLRVIFLPGVKGNVTYEFSGLPLDAAFKKLLLENGLESSYDRQSRTVTIAPVSTVKREVSLFSPSAMSLKELESSLHRLGVLFKGGVDTVFDTATQSVMLRGSNERIQKVSQIIKSLDDGKKKQQEREASNRRKEYEQVFLDRAKEKVKEVDAVKVKIFTLKYARVGSSTMTFQGETVQVPGIGETLRTFIGLSHPGLLSQPQPNNTQPSPQNHPPGIPGNFQEALGVVMNRNSFDPGSPPGVRKDDIVPSNATVFGSDKVNIAIDERTNSVIVQASPKIIDEIGKTIQKLDQPQPLVEIEVIIAKAEKGVRQNLGVQWGGAQRSANRNNAIGITGGGSATDQIVTVAGAEEAAATLASESGSTTSTDKVDPISLLPLVGDAFKLSYIFRGSKALFEAQINALSAANQLQTVASPRIVTLDKLPAKITKSDKVNIPITTGDGTRSGVQEVNADISINITPFVIPSDTDGEPPMLRLEINAKHSTLGAVTADKVQTAEQELQTQVVVPNAATFILGGLFDNEKTESNTGVPGLQDIPILGNLFKSKSVSDTRRETLFFITATVRDYDVLTGGRGIGIRDFVHYQRSTLHKPEDYLTGQKKRP